ncbi:FAD dependent oxidoreductase-domain-containing protein [Talaromyces proteolyticus]|uniref:FAD dependent oxidoreductase-domain-containing protein n=1 Tax=Talaromyces proteolyticus TaxID=1131652 RepID=A0AAD4L8D7_9EURO|nr:FAD dependent oxidoreductase-domain-containing protein [Talaromyces proteolyticus]KAH8705784.1 FAD dependent oxidoreductase-domain-containing protein [Talaromyces proteolyticus]
MGCILSHIRIAYFSIRILVGIMEEARADLNAARNRILRPSLPIPNPSASFWQQNPVLPELVNIQSKSLPEMADIVIIGSGISGASVAHTILTSLRSEKSLRVVVLEAREICSGATGRNGGHIKCAPYAVYAGFKARFGSERAKKLLAFQRKALPLLVDFAQRMKFTHAEVREVETIDIFTDETMWKKAKSMVHLLRQDLPDVAESVEIHEAEAGCKKFGVSGEHCFGIISYQAGALWPYRFVTSLYATLLSTFASTFSVETNTPVTEVRTQNDKEKPFLVCTSRGEIAARHVVHATDAFAPVLVPGIRGKLFPIRGHMTAQRPGNRFPDCDGSRSWSIVGRRGYEYISQRPGKPHSEVHRLGRELMVGGGAIQSPGRGIDECGVWRDDQLCSTIGAYLDGILPATFGKDNWGDDVDGSRIKQAWVGCMGFTADALPYVGKLETELTRRNVDRFGQRSDSNCGGEGYEGIQRLPPAEWICAGFGGEGMVLAWLSGAAVAVMMLGLEDEHIQGSPVLPEGKLMDWLPEEFICSKSRVDRSDAAGLLELL